MAQLVQLTQQSDDVKKLFQLNAQRMMRAAPKGFDPQRLLAVAFNAIAYNSDLLMCTRESLIGGTFEAVKLGLTLGGPMQEAWLIPFSARKQINGQWESVKEATLIIGYQGYRNLVDRARSTLDMHPRSVHNGMTAGAIDAKTKRPAGFSAGTPDEFDFWFGDEPRIVHRPRNPMPEWKEQLRAVYVVARLRGGGKQMEVLEIEEVERHRNRSRAKDNGPWVTDYVPMALKTGIRKIAKYLPKASLELARAMALDEQADIGEGQDFDIEGMVIPQADPAATQGTNAPPTKALEGLKQTMRVPTPTPKEAVRVDAGRTTGGEATVETQAPPVTADEIDWGGGR